MIRLRKGLDLPLPGAPAQAIQGRAATRSVGVVADDYPGLRPALAVRAGERVRAGQVILNDMRRPEIRVASPAAGRIAAIHLDDRRLSAVEIDVDGDACVEYPRLGLDALRGAGRERVCERLLESGDWTALRARPFGGLATPGTRPAAIFVRAMDSNPLAVDAGLVLRERLDDLCFGLTALTTLPEGPVFLCSRPGMRELWPEVAGVTAVEFAGPHPAGLVGTHIHHLLPASQSRSLWYLGYQDVLAIGRLFREGRPDASRVVSVAGPAVARPRIVRTTLGASTEDLIAGELGDARCRVVSGSVLSGRVAARPVAFLGRYHDQVSVLPERAPRSRRPRLPALFRRWAPWRTHRFSTELHGEPEALLPLDLFERVFPLSLPVGPLLRALAARDVRSALALGALELEEEDLALCSYHCASKLDYGRLLRHVLDVAAEELS